ncbi:hypothetical protein [Nocardia higoensis]|uniref:hypothetical protein n=1 Tax=Nocardia higoensis TaxID=228599 RepID=UPI0012F70669|nr:hypothetical protein [Nocardia higoensis]
MQSSQTEAQQRRRRGFRIEFDEFFFGGLLAMGPVRPATEFSQDRSRPSPQLRDEDTGLWVWRLPVSDPAASSSTRMSYDVYILAESEPVMPSELVPGVCPIRLTDVTIAPRLAGPDDRRYIAYTVRARGIEAAHDAQMSGSGKPAGPIRGNTAPGRAEKTVSD